MTPNVPPPLTHSVIGRLLDELSWVGNTIRSYRNGAAGYENVLVAEVLLALDFLPRARFLGAVLASATGADRARAHVIAEVEESSLVVLPPEIFLTARAGSGRKQIGVQPDASLIGPTTWTLVEAKRLRSGTFQQEQLAREYVSVMAQTRVPEVPEVPEAPAVPTVPLLLLIIPSGPEVMIDKLGRMSPQQAIEATLGRVLDAMAEPPGDLATLSAKIPDVLAWVTWQQIGSAMKKARADFTTDDKSVAGTITRLCDLIVESLHRHQ